MSQIYSILTWRFSLFKHSILTWRKKCLFLFLVKTKNKKHVQLLKVRRSFFLIFSRFFQNKVLISFGISKEKDKKSLFFNKKIWKNQLFWLFVFTIPNRKAESKIECLFINFLTKKSNFCDDFNSIKRFCYFRWILTFISPVVWLLRNEKIKK